MTRDSRKKRQGKPKGADSELIRARPVGTKDFTKFVIGLLRPHRMRIFLGLSCMFLSSFFGTYNLFIAKPALDVMFGNVRSEERRKDLVMKWEEKRGKIEAGLQSNKISVRWAGELIQILHPIEEAVERRVLSFYEYADLHKFGCLQAIAILLITMSFLNGICLYTFQYNISFSVFSAIMRMRSDLFRSVIRQDMAFFGRHSVGYLMSRIGNDVADVRRIIEYFIRNILEQATHLLFIISALFVLNFRLTLYAFIGLIPALIVLSFLTRILKKATRKQKDKTDLLSSTVNESLQNMRLIKSLSTEEIENQKFDQRNLHVFQLDMNRRIARFASSPLMVFFGSIAFSALFLVGGYIVLEKKMMEPSTFIIYIVLLSQFYRPLKQLGDINVGLQTARVSVARIREMLLLQPDVQDPPENLPPVKIDTVKQNIAFRNVHFSYRDQVVLEDLAIEITRNTTNAIVGRSGAGKSTFANLLLRLYDPDSGKIEIDGVDLRHMRRKDLHKLFGVVSQETVLFKDSIANNIAYGSGDPDSVRVEIAARHAYAHDFIMNLDGGRGYETMVGPSGCTLSGGQRQRLALARAFYRNPQILILDEATSALDNESEAAIQRALQELMEDRTVIIIAHRLSTIMHANSIFVLDNGRLIEKGTHADLLTQKGFYFNLYNRGEYY